MNDLTVWQNTEKIRALFAPNLTAEELLFFMGLGKALKANPFTREIWAVKYDRNQPAAIFCGRDFYRRLAQEQADYEGHNVQSVYSNDLIEIENGEVKKHVPNLREPGDIIGAYCILWRLGKKAFFHLVRFREYFKGFSNWKTMPETMIKKVAEAQTLRMAYQGIFRGTYDESENWIVDAEAAKPETQLPQPIAKAESIMHVEKEKSTIGKAQNEKTGASTTDIIQKIAGEIGPELREIFSNRRMSTSKIIEVWNRHHGNQKSIITEMTERKAA